MRQSRANYGDRSNALWGRGSRGESRSNALWGRGGRRAGAIVVMVAGFAMASVAGAGVASLRDNGNSGSGKGLKAFVPSELLSVIQQNPAQTFDVIVQGEKKGTANGFYKQLAGDNYAGNVRQQFSSINGVEASLTGNQILALGKRSYVTSIMGNESVAGSAVQLPLSNQQLWPWAT